MAFYCGVIHSQFSLNFDVSFFATGNVASLIRKPSDLMSIRPCCCSSGDFRSSPMQCLFMITTCISAIGIASFTHGISIFSNLVGVCFSCECACIRCVVRSVREHPDKLICLAAFDGTWWSGWGFLCEKGFNFLFGI